MCEFTPSDVNYQKSPFCGIGNAVLIRSHMSTVLPCYFYLSHLKDSLSCFVILPSARVEINVWVSPGYQVFSIHYAS